MKDAGIAWGVFVQIAELGEAIASLQSDAESALATLDERLIVEVRP